MLQKTKKLSLAGLCGWASIPAAGAVELTGGTNYFAPTLSPDPPVREWVDLFGSLSLLGTLCVASIAVLYLRQRFKPPIKRSGPESPTDAGIHGWLKFFLIYLGILTGLGLFGRQMAEFQSFETARPDLVNDAQWLSFKHATWLAISVFSTCSVCIAISKARRLAFISS